MRSEPGEHEVPGEESWGMWVSDAIDGVSAPRQLDGLLAHARRDAGIVATWHCYQVIGDVLRSDELAGRGRDREFLLSLRERLAREPVVFAPEPQVAGSIASGMIRRPRIVAAGLAAAAVAVVVGYAGLGLPGAGPQLAGNPAESVVVAEREPAALQDSDALQLVVTPNGQMLRDAALDQYLQAHRQFSGSTPLQLPAGFVRNATVELPR